MLADEGGETLWVIGLGSNLGDRLDHLRRAAEALGALPMVRLVGRSEVIETPPAGGPPQPDYLNAAIAISTALTARDLLDHALAIERQLGRTRPDPVRWGPRTIDIDLLWADRRPVDEPGLQVPHPRLSERPFALVPLLELVPDACDPTSGEPYLELPAAQVGSPSVGKL
jgi:2-amino-4-hydroxy-6-hydroxymethyldihydropteridine diphosphokinase